jgi:AcrR family transcriptional regulator
MNKSQAQEIIAHTHDDPRDRILNAAVGIFSQKGLDGTRTREIAKAAGVNLAMLHYYFSSKEELYARAVSPLLGDLFSRLNAAALDHGNPVAKLEAVVNVYFDFLPAHPYLPRLMMWDVITGARALKKIFSGPLQDEKSDLIAHFSGIFRNGQTSGRFKPHDPYQAILSTVALCVFPFIARDMIAAVQPQLIVSSDFLAQRRQHVLELLLSGLKASAGEARSEESKSEPDPLHQQISLTL